MSLKLLGNKKKAAQSTQGAQQTQQGSGITPAEGSPDALDAAQREATMAASQAARYKREAEEAKRQLEDAKRVALAEKQKGAILAIAAKHNVRNPEHFYAMVREDFTIVGDKIVRKDKSDMDLDGWAKDFFEKDGAYLVGPTVPGGGAGTQGIVNGSQVQRPKLDENMQTREGATNRTRRVFNQMLDAKDRELGIIPGGRPQGNQQQGNGQQTSQ